MLTRLNDSAQLLCQQKCSCPATPGRCAANLTPRIYLYSDDDMERLQHRQHGLQFVVLHVTAPAQKGSLETRVTVKGVAEERAAVACRVAACDLILHSKVCMQMSGSHIIR